MGKEYFRTGSDVIRGLYRKKAIALIKKGVKKGAVADLFGVNKNCVSNWWRKYESSGNSGYKSKKKGVKSEDEKLLSLANEKAVQLKLE